MPKEPIIDTKTIFNQQKFDMTLMALSDVYNWKVRELIKRTYESDEIHANYRGIRISGVYDKGSKDKSRRKIIAFPNAYVHDFLERVMGSLYGPDWLQNKKALNHELVRPWHVVSKL